MSPDASILERDAQLDELRTALGKATEGIGSVVLVCGEAGIGKTTLIDAFADPLRDTEVPVLRGACDALRTPRPLGPLLDIARQTGGRLRAIAEGEPERERLFAAFLDLLRRRRPCVVVIEDVHWADFATLDLLTFLGRRTRETSALLIVTFRDDELPIDHPLRQTLATIPRDGVRRLPLTRLSPAAVDTLARQAGRAAGDLHALTSGNPFYVREVLASPEETVPPSVQDAVFARTIRLPEAARNVLDAVAVEPSPLERWLLDEVTGPRTEDVQACIDCGVLVAQDGRLGFRHELARQAWRRRLDASEARSLHVRLLDALERGVGGALGGGDSGGRRRFAVEAARLVHHASGAGDDAAVLRLAPAAAEEAARLGAHREAAAHYEAALAAGRDLERRERAGLLEALGRESFLVGRNDRAVAALEEARAIRRTLGDRRKQSEDERWLARVAWFRGDDEAVRRHCDQAIEVAEPMGESAELARAYALRSQILMCAEEAPAAMEWGERALRMARAVDDRETLAHSLINVGCAMLMAGDPAGRARLEQALELAREHGLHDAEARTLVNLAEIAVDWRDMEGADAALERAITYCTQRDMDPYALCALGARAVLRLWRARWSAAADDAAAILDHPRVPSVDRIPALAVLGLLRARRGDPDARPLLDEARELAAPTREPHRIAPVAAARAEAAWLDGELASAVDELRMAYDMALERTNPWATGELAFWLWRAGALEEVPDAVAEPYGLHMRGDARGAADAWGRMGFPYERALALADGDDASSAREGLRILRELGASRVAELVASELREKGVSSLPRGPRPATRHNPAGLTPRQLQVLDLLAEGLSNQAIAGRLHISIKTVEHHVSAVLAKLDVRSRTEAALRAAELGQAGGAGPT